jgi:hypothetical protein
MLAHMATFKKPVLAVGRYRTRSGEWLDATEDRLRGWSDKFRAMRREGIKLPLSWGHQPLAEPLDPFADPNDPEVRARREFSSSAYCAGQLDDIEYDPASKTLYATGSAPGADIDQDGNLLAWVKLPDGTQLRSAVNEVSIGVNNWIDGKGRLHEDVPIHLALCVRPVAHGLGGFLALSTDNHRLPCPPGHEAHCSATGCECRPVPLRAFSTFAGPVIEMAGWVNSATGKVRYQANAPRSRDGSTWSAKQASQPRQQQAAPQQPAQPRQPAPQAIPKQQPVPAQKPRPAQAKPATPTPAPAASAPAASAAHAAKPAPHVPLTAMPGLAAAIEKHSAPQQGAGKGGAQPTFPRNKSGLIDVRAWLDKPEYDPDGKGANSVKAFDELAGHLDKHLKSGGKVFLHTDGGGKKVAITSIQNGRLRDDKGQPWGLLAASMPSNPDKEGLELQPASGKQSEIPIASPADDGARNTAEARRVAEKQTKPIQGLSAVHQTLLSGKAIAPDRMPHHTSDKTARTAWGKGFLQKAFKRGHRSPADLQKAHAIVTDVFRQKLKGKALASAMNAALQKHFPTSDKAREDSKGGRYHQLSAELLLAAEHAPKGGITIAGKAFRGGQFIPAAVMAQASPEEKQKLEATKSAGRERLKAHVGEKGPDPGALREKLGQYANLDLKDHQVKDARRLYNGIKSYHGDMALHRIHQLIHEDEKKLSTAKPADKQRLYRRLKGYHHMLDWHEQGQEKAAAEEKASRTGVQNVPFEKLHVDPERFQYKLNTGKSGVVREGSALEGVKRFRPEFAGAILVWHDPADKKTYVVNGHHRHDLAKKAGQKNMAVLYMEAKDAKEARKVGALANIAEGRGTAVDAAKLIRDEQFKPEDFQAEGVSLKGSQAKNAFVLAKLSEGLFSKLVKGQLDEKSALAIAGIESHEHQHQFADWLDKQDRDIPDRVLQRMAQKIQNTSGVKTKTAGLFGEEENDENLFLHRATLETHALAKLSAEANLFGAVSSDKKAAKLQSKVGDNQLDVEKNKEVADEARQHRAVLAKLVDRKGPIADAFNSAAEELYREPKKRKQIEERLLEAVRGLVKQEVGGPATAAGSGAAANGAGKAREGERPSPAEQRAERVEPQFMPSAARKTKES